MSIGFLIMILVSYNLEIINAAATQRLLEGTYLSFDTPRSSVVTPYEIEDYLKPVEKYIEYHAYETHEIDRWYTYIGERELFVSDDLALVQIPVSVSAVSPFFADTLISEYIVTDKVNDTTDLSLSEQLYTARGIQGAGMGGWIMKQLNLHPDDWEQTFKINLFTESWNVYTKNRCIFSTTVMPGKNMNSRDTGAENNILISIPQLKKIMQMTTSPPYFPFERVNIKLHEPSNEDHIKIVKKQLDTLASRKDASVYDYTSAEGSFNSATAILDVVFNVIIASVMFL